MLYKPEEIIYYASLKKTKNLASISFQKRLFCAFADKIFETCLFILRIDIEIWFRKSKFVNDIILYIY